MPIVVAGTFTKQPLGVILHGSRSGDTSRTLEKEYAGTVRWASENPQGLCWNVTIGPSAYTEHIDARHWGFNAREHSDEYLAAEFSQATVNNPIGNDQVAQFVLWFRDRVLPVWPGLLGAIMNDAGLPAHAELPAGIRDGKSDTFRRSDTKTADLRQRIRAAVTAAVSPHNPDLDAALEAVWLTVRDRLGDKRNPGAGALDRPDWGGKVLLLERGALVATPDGIVHEITERVIDDFITYAEADGSLVRYGEG